MDRRSFLKAAAAAAVAPALPAVAMPAPLPLAIDANLGTVTSGALYRNCVVIYERGTRWFDAQGKVWMTEVDDGDFGAPMVGVQVDDLGEARVVMGTW